MPEVRDTGFWCQIDLGLNMSSAICHFIWPEPSGKDVGTRALKDA